MKVELIVLFILLIVFESGQQMFFKLGGIKVNNRVQYYLSGILMYLLSIGIWFKIIKHMPLGIALPLMGINYVIVALTGMYVFKESINVQRWMGISLILIGFILVWLGGGSVYE